MTKGVAQGNSVSGHAISMTHDDIHVFFDAMPDGVAFHQLIYGEDGTPTNYRIIHVNEQFEKLTGISAAIAKDKVATELYGMASPPYGDVYFHVAKKQEIARFEIHFPPMDKHFSVTAIPWGKDGFITVFSNIIKSNVWNEFDDQEIDHGMIHSDSKEQLIQLSQEIHDGVCQDLVAVSFMSDLLIALPELQGKGREFARKIKQQTSQTLENTRTQARRLVDAQSDEVSLREKLQGLAKKTEEIFKISCKCNLEFTPLTIDSEFCQHLFRIAQEAVTNAIKHSCPSHICLELTRKDEQLVLTIANDGIPFPDLIDLDRSLGVRMMRYRAKLLGGTLNFEKSLNGCLIVKFTILESVIQSHYRPVKSP